MIFLIVSDIYSQTSFVDITASKGILPFQSREIYGSGVSAADYDKDGLIDLFVSTNPNSPSHLYKNLGNGNFEEILGQVGIDEDINSRMALWFDYNGDHLLDLFVAGDCYRESSPCPDSSVMRLYQQISPSQFIEVTESAGLSRGIDFTTGQMIGGLAAGDLNNDGMLDLIVSYWNGKLYLFMNNGDGTFTETGASTLIADTKFYLQPLLYDFNKDGLMDIYLNVDGGENLFWLNEGGSFSEISSDIQLNSSFNEMGTALGDYDNDEDMDIYISNVFGPLSHNVFFKNNSTNGSLAFTEVANDLRVDDGGWGWGVTFFDANNDGFLDLAETNGFTTEWRTPAKFWINNRSGGFDDISAEVGFVDDLDGTTLIALDFDRDGDLDLVESLKNRQGQSTGLRLLENQLNTTEQFGNYLVIKPRMNGFNHFAIGSTVKIKMGNTILSRPILAGTSFYGQEPAEAFFGLGEETKIDEIIIEWPGGTISRMAGVDANQVITVTDDGVLHTPTNLSISNVDVDKLTLNWSHIPTNETGFLLQKSITENFESVNEIYLDSLSRSYEDTNLDYGTKYYYRLQVINHSTTSEFSKTVLGIPQEFIETPTELSVFEFDHKKIVLQWRDNSSNETAFIIQRAPSIDFNEFIEFEVEEDINSLLNDNLNSNNIYYYRVKAVNNRGVSKFSEPIFIKTLDFIEKPLSLEGATNNFGQVLLTWVDPAQNEEGFVIERSITPQFQYTQKFTLDEDITYFTDANIVPGTHFYYRVKAYNENVSSEFSNTFTIIIPINNLEENNFFFYPNPMQESINVKLNNDYYGLVNLTITNILGQILVNKQYDKNQKIFDEIININSSPGIYFLSLSLGTKIFQKKIIKK